MLSHKTYIRHGRVGGKLNIINPDTRTKDAWRTTSRPLYTFPLVLTPRHLVPWSTENSTSLLIPYFVGQTQRSAISLSSSHSLPGIYIPHNTQQPAMQGAGNTRKKEKLKASNAFHMAERERHKTRHKNKRRLTHYLAPSLYIFSRTHTQASRFVIDRELCFSANSLFCWSNAEKCHSIHFLPEKSTFQAVEDKRPSKFSWSRLW